MGNSQSVIKKKNAAGCVWNSGLYGFLKLSIRNSNFQKMPNLEKKSMCQGQKNITPEIMKE